METLKKIGYLFYLVNPKETMFEKLEELPKPSYINQAIPYFLGMVLIENVIRVSQGKGVIRLNDGVMSGVHGLLMLCSDMVYKGFTLAAYCHIFEHYCVYQLPWDSTLTWVIAAIAYDLCYYWVHRFSHEINLFWAAHQVHHSSEEYNLTTALRQSMFQHLFTGPINLALAFFVPPATMLVHSQFNTLFQFWIHSEIVGDLGPLEYILNTSNHHKVHHGSNRYCLDKNYAGFLIIWDRMFGTFEPIRPHEKIVYGLVDQPQYFNPMKHQLHYFVKVFEKALGMEKWSDRISAFLKGPGWFPGTERLGDISMVPKIQDREVYDPQVSVMTNVYAILHFFATVVLVTYLGGQHQMSQMVVFGLILSAMWTLTSIGMLFDRNPVGWPCEMLRTGIYTAVSLLFFTNNNKWAMSFNPIHKICLLAFYGLSLSVATFGLVSSQKQLQLIDAVKTDQTLVFNETRDDKKVQ